MGIFSEWQPQYAAHNLITFPVVIEGKAKRPAGKGRSFMVMGQQGSSQLASKARDCDTFGIYLDRHDLDILDVDSPDEKRLADGLSRHGDTPFVIRTHSGKFHALYQRKAGSERRRFVRPRGGLPDTDYLLGKGLWVCPPSLSEQGQYRIIRGSLDDLDRLPEMKGLEGLSGPRAVIPASVADGTRDDTVFRHCMAQAHHVGTLEELIDIARWFNETACVPPLPDAQAVAKAKSAWDYQERGLNRFGTGRIVTLDHDVIDTLAASNPYAFALLGILKKHHWGRDEFTLAKGMAKSLGWTLPRWKEARTALTDMGIIECIHPGGDGPNDPPEYRWC